MQSLFSRTLSFTSLGLIIFLFTFLFPMLAHACADSDSAMKSCQGTNWGAGYTCQYHVSQGLPVDGSHAESGYAYYIELSNGGGDYAKGVCPTPSTPSDPCAGYASQNGAFAGAIKDGSSMCATKGSGTSGCSMSFKSNGPAFAQTGGGWAVSGTYTPSHASCNKTTDPAAPAAAPSKSCGGASCYDSSGDKYCISTAAGQLCVSGASGRSPSGGCTSNSTNAVCAGSPTAATPPAPPASPISDPASEQTAADKYLAQDTKSGANQTISVTVSGAGGKTSPSTSGKASGDGSAPASGSSVGSKGSCTAGQICNDSYAASPCGSIPSVAGDPLLGAIAKDIHTVACANGASQSDFDAADHSKGDDHTASEVEPTASSVVSMDTLDATGFLAHGGCPGFAPVMYLGTNILRSDGICATADILSKFMLVLGYILAAMIIGKVRAYS